jgi:NDP-sugar pyrophosphorylase family protein
MQTAERTAGERNQAVRAGDVSHVLVLAGGLQPPQLADQLGVSTLWLPATAAINLMDRWRDAFRRLNVPDQRVVLLTGSGDNPDLSVPEHPFAELRDSGPFRGPAGALRDGCESLRPDGPCVIVEGNRYLSSDAALADVVREHAASAASVTVATNPDGTFAGVLVADPAAIGVIPRIGFMDIKEQWLPAAAKDGHSVRPATLSGFCRPVRTLRGYLAVLRAAGQFGGTTSGQVLGPGVDCPVARPYGGALVRDSANVADGAVVSESALCEGCVVGEGSIVARSVIGPGASVEDGQIVVDTVVSAADLNASR